MPAAPPLPIRVCPKHGLVAGPDGRCMICHRGAAATDDGGGARRLVLGLAAAAALVAAVAVWKTRQRPPATFDNVIAPPAFVAPPPPPPDDQEPALPPPGEPVASPRVTEERDRQRSIEAEMHRVPIRMYMARTCSICDEARDWLKENGMTYSEVDVNSDPSVLEALKKLTPNPIVPTFDVDGEVLVSFAPTLVLAAARRAADRRTRL